MTSHADERSLRRKIVFIVRKTTMISACPTTRRPTRPLPSLSTWSSSLCADMSSARWQCVGGRIHTEASGLCQGASSSRTKALALLPLGSSLRRQGSWCTKQRGRVLVSIWNSWRPMVRPSGIHACVLSALLIWCWLLTFPLRYLEGTRRLLDGRQCARCFHEAATQLVRSRPRPWLSTMSRFLPMVSNEHGPRSSIRLWRRPSARRSSPSASCVGCTRRSGVWSSTPGTFTARSRELPVSSCLRAAPRPVRVGGQRSCSGLAGRRCSTRRCSAPRPES